MTDSITEFRAALDRVEQIIVTTHVNPDGDAVGSVLGMRSILEQLGRQAEVVLNDPIPPKYRFLIDRPVRLVGDPGLDELLKDNSSLMIVCLDVSERERIGSVLDWYENGAGTDPVIVNIDHHISNDGFGDIVIIDSERSSAAELVLEIADSLGVELTSQAADQLYAGVLTDTGCFQYSNTNVASLRAAGDLVEAGAVPSRVADRIYHRRSLYFYRLLGFLLRSMELHLEDRVCVMSLPAENAQALWPGGEMDTEGIVDYTIQMADVAVGIFIREADAGTCRASLRSRGGVNVQEVTEPLGGGGHASAAGCTLEGTLEETRARLLAEVEKHLR